MIQRPRDLTALLGSRICHDLISPIGAIGNGLELMAMSGASKGPEMELINASVLNAQARIRFYRVAYGSNNDGPGLGTLEVIEILRDVTQGSRTSYNWQADGEVRRGDAKLIFLLLQCIESATPYGGQITIRRAKPNWSISCQAGRLKSDPQLWAQLTDGPALDDLTPSQIQFALAPRQASAMELDLNVRMTETDIEISF